MFANLANLTHPADSSLVFRVIFGAIERALFVRRAAVNWCKTGSTNLEFSKLIKLNVNGVVRVSLALGFGSSGLAESHSLVRQILGRHCAVISTYIFYNLCRAPVGNNSVGKAQGGIVVLAFDS